MIVERIDKRITLGCKIGAAAFLGWIASSSWHQTFISDRAAIDIPVVRAEAGCEHRRAEKAIGVAKQTITAANTEDAVLPNVKALPLKDCPH